MIRHGSNHRVKNSQFIPTSALPDGIQLPIVSKHVANERLHTACTTPSGLQLRTESHLRSWLCLTNNMGQMYKPDVSDLSQRLSASLPYELHG